MKVLIISPHGTPISGIANTTARLTHWLSSCSDIEFDQVDAGVRWRSEVNLSLWVRLCGGSIHGMRIWWSVVRKCRTFQPDVVLLSTSGSLAFIRDIVVMASLRLLG